MDENTNGFNDWESLPFNFHTPNSSSSSSSQNHSPSQSPNHNYNPNYTHNDDNYLSIFHPSNHEDLPITNPQPQIPSSSSSPPNSNSNPNSSSSPPQNPLFIKWFDFALHLWNSKLISFFNLLRSKGLFSLVLPVVSTASFLGFCWFWIRRRRRRLRRYTEKKESVEQLKVMIMEKDEKIIQLLEQIALMNKVLLARYKVPVLKAS